MGKVSDFFHNKSIKNSFTIYMLGCILLAILLSLLFSNICQFGQAQIYKKYQIEYENTDNQVELNFHEENEENYGVLYLYMHTKDITAFFTLFEDVTYNVLGFLSIACYPFCFVLCIIITSILFYKRELQKPLEILDAAADKIAENNLNFQIVYDKQDELGKLCSSFEKMRVALQDNNMEMWRQMEERKRLNAAFAHDLRTPLTVLKGQSEMLLKYASQMPADKIISTAEMMKKHITRLETYVKTMNDLQRLEDIEVNRHPIFKTDFIAQLRETGEAICKSKKFIFSEENLNTSEMNIDLDMVLQVYENLLSNAVRYAKEQIYVSICIRNSSLSIIVTDDGNGFQAKDLLNATKPFYKSTETNHDHLGMGLNICKILCEKHGGFLTLSNKQGASVTAVFQLS